MADGTFIPIRDRRVLDDADTATLRATYPVGGSAAAVAPMPWRTPAACNRQARKLGLKAGQPERAPTRHFADTWVDDQIRAFYGKPIGRNTLQPFAKSIGRPHWYVKRRAAQLGVIVPRLRELPWSEAELEILHENAGLAAGTIRKRLKRAGFNRSETAITVKRKREELNSREERDLAGIYTARKVALGLGASPVTVLRWIKVGRLKATRRRDDGGAHTEWDVRKKDLQAFLATYPTAIDLRKVDREWFFDMAFGDRL